jgi:hypothetical protein
MASWYVNIGAKLSAVLKRILTRYQSSTATYQDTVAGLALPPIQQYDSWCGSGGLARYFGTTKDGRAAVFGESYPSCNGAPWHPSPAAA